MMRIGLRLGLSGRGGGAASSEPTVLSSSNRLDSAASSHPITMPEGVEAGDLVVVVFSSRGSSTVSVSSGTGWTEEYENFFNVSTVRQTVYTKTADGSDALTLATSGVAHSSHAVYVLRGYGTTFAAGTPTQSNGASNPDPPSFSPAGGEAEYAWLSIISPANTVVPTAAPSGYDGLIAQAGVTSGVGTAIAYRVATAASEDPGAWTMTFAAHTLNTLAVTGGG